MIRSIAILFLVFVSTIVSSIADDYYWVGGSGGWSEYATHWAKSSNGNAFHRQVPGPLDNVIFDNNSLSGKTTVTLDQTIVSCKDITVSISRDSLILFPGTLNSRITIYGSTVLSPKFKIQNDVKIYFQSGNGLSTIKQNGAVLNCFLFFDNVGGSWKLLDAMQVYSVQILNGNLDVSNRKITCEMFKKEGSNSCVLNFSNTIFIVQWLKIYDNEMNDITSGLKVYSRADRGDGFTLTLQGSTFTVDSVFASKGNSGSANLEGDAHIKYASIKDYGTLYTMFEGTIDRLDIKNVNLFNNAYDIKIGTLRMDNSREIVIHYKFTANFFYYTGTLDCNNFFRFNSENDGRQVILNIKNKPATLNYYSFTNIDASAYPLDVSNGLDLGTNSGIAFLSHAGETPLYRIGDGLWSDPSKWSYTSNGPAANCLPTDYTPVILDKFSFTNSSSTLDIDNGTCKSITIKNLNTNLKLKGELNCHGSFISTSPLVNDYLNINFASAADSNFVQIVNGTGDLWTIYFFEGNYFFKSNISSLELHNRGAVIHTKGYALKSNNISLKSGYFYGYTSLIHTVDFEDETVATSTDLKNTSIVISNYFSVITGGLHTYGSLTLEGVYTFGTIDYQMVLNSSIKHLHVNKDVQLHAFSMHCDTLSILKGSDLLVWADTLDVGILNMTGQNQCGIYTILRGKDSLVFNSKRNVVFEAFILENIKANISKGITYSAINSIDGLNNTGIGFTSVQGNTFYWIGGSGDWKDPLHWSATSGGPSKGCIPSRVDNVYFDENSFTAASNEVRIHDFIECADFNFQNSKPVVLTGIDPSFTGKNMNVFGSFLADSNLTYYFVHMFFKGLTPSVVHTHKNIFFRMSIQKQGSIAFTGNFKTSEFNVYSGTTSFVNTQAYITSLFATYKGEDSLIILDTKMTVESSFYLYVKNGKMRHRSNLFEMNCYNNNYSQITIGSDSIPVSIGDLHIVLFNPDNMPAFPLPNTVSLKNVLLDTLYVGTTMNTTVELLLFNTEIDQLLSFNDVLTIKKANQYDIILGGGNGNGNEEEFNRIANIKNAQINSYVNSVRNVSFDYLKIYPGVSVDVFAGDTLYVNQSMDVTGSPASPIEIGSTINGVQAFIQNNGSICGEYIYIHDNAVKNKPAFAGYLSSDVLNNEGWTFNASCDTILCSYSQTPCEDGSIQFSVITQQILVNTSWSGPQGFFSTDLSPALNNIQQQNKGLYTFASTQGKCSLYVDVFLNPVNPIYNELTDGYLTVSNPFMPLTWYKDQVEIPNEHSAKFYPSETGSYQVQTTSSRGCVYMSDVVSFVNAGDGGIIPNLTYVGQEGAQEIKIQWDDLAGETGYMIYGSSPSSSDPYSVITSISADETTAFIPADQPGEYCFYIRGFYQSMSNLTLSSDTLCVTLLTTDVLFAAESKTCFYPNPNNVGSLLIKPAIADMYTISIENMLGENVYSKEGLSGKQQLTFDLSQGIYIVKLISGSYSTSEKLIILK